MLNCRHEFSEVKFDAVRWLDEADIMWAGAQQLLKVCFHTVFVSHVSVANSC